jgi:hypothetical protein
LPGRLGKERCGAPVLGQREDAYRARSPEPCRVTVGRWTIDGVYFPARRATRERVKALALRTLREQGLGEDPFSYPVPEWFQSRPHLLGLFRYYLARMLAGVEEVHGVGAGGGR